MDSEARKTREVAALGRPFGLGMLYDCRQDSLVPGKDSHVITKYIKAKQREHIAMRLRNLLVVLLQRYQLLMIKTREFIRQLPQMQLRYPPPLPNRKGKFVTISTQGNSKCI